MFLSRGFLAALTFAQVVGSASGAERFNEIKVRELLLGFHRAKYD
jgi:hypothetical protein